MQSQDAARSICHCVIVSVLQCSTASSKLALQWLANNWKEVCTLARVACSRRGRMDLYDDLLSEAVDRIGRIHENHDDTLSTILTHVRVDLRWYFWKKLNAIEKYHNTHSEIVEEPFVCEEFAVDTNETVQYVMQRLSEFDRRLLTMRYVDNMTYEQISDELRTLSASSIKDKYLPSAMKHAQQIAQQLIQKVAKPNAMG